MNLDVIRKRLVLIKTLSITSTVINMVIGILCSIGAVLFFFGAVAFERNFGEAIGLISVDDPDSIIVGGLLSSLGLFGWLTTLLAFIFCASAFSLFLLPGIWGIVANANGQKKLSNNPLKYIGGFSADAIVKILCSIPSFIFTVKVLVSWINSNMYHGELTGVLFFFIVMIIPGMLLVMGVVQLVSSKILHKDVAAGRI